jgi:hypothetical protein
VFIKPKLPGYLADLHKHCSHYVGNPQWLLFPLHPGWIPEYDFISVICLVLKVAVVEQVSDFNCLGNVIFGEGKDRIKLQGIIKWMW